jgi:drug/metabolite transporter (DMT)-like permease
MLLYMRAITQHPLSLTLPFMAFTPVFVIATGYLILGETVRPEGFAGILLVFAGGWLMNIRHARGSLLQAALRPLHAIWAETGSRLMLGVALIYAVTAVVSKKAMEFMPPAQFGAFYYQLIGLSVLLLFSLDQPGRWRRIWRRPWPVLLVALFTAVMVTSHFLALQWVEAAYMISVKRTSMVFSILYGLIWFREAEGWTRLTAGMIMLAGVVLIANAPAMG